MLLKQPSQGNVVTEFLPNGLKFNATLMQKKMTCQKCMAFY